MVKILLITGISLLLVIGLSCAARQTSAPSEPAPAAPVPQAARETGQAEWDKLLAQAKKEGTVSVYGAAWGDMGRLLQNAFKKAYGLELEYIGLEGRNLAPKFMAERRGNIHLADIIIAGTTTILTTFKEMAVPIEPLFILPEVKDPKVWLDGKHEFADEEGKYNLAFINTVLNPVIYNTQLVDSKKLEGASYWEFTKPEWKDKIIMNDPRAAGAGLAMATFFFTTQGLGLDYMKALAKNNVLLHRDHRIMAEWVGRGKYLVEISPTTVEPRVLMREGMPLAYIEHMREGTVITASSGSMMFVDKAPHPKAARVFLNWFLSKEGQYIVSKESQLPSRRIDIPRDHLDPKAVPKAGRAYQPNHLEVYVKMRDDIVRQMNDIYGR